MPIPVADPDDPRIEPYRAVRDRDLAGRHGLFVAEGDLVVRTLLSPSSRFAAVSVLVAESRRAALAGWLAGLPPALPVFLAPQPVMDRIVGFPIHRGILALGRRGPDPGTDVVLARSPDHALVLGLVGLANHDNVGGLFRNAAAFGADAVLLDQDTCDPLYRKAIRVSVGAALRVPFGRAGSAADLVSGLERHGFDVVGLSPGAPLRLDAATFGRRVALLVGAEGPGLPPALLARTRGLRIDMAADTDSLNVATAAGIALHAVRVARAARRPAPEGGPAGD